MNHSKRCPVFVHALTRISAFALVLFAGVTTTSSLRSAEIHSQLTDPQLAAKAKRLQGLVETKVLQEHGII